MTILDLLIILVAVLSYGLLHTPLWLTVVFTIVAIVLARALRGERP